MGRDVTRKALFCLPTVSIHAPAWGATSEAINGLITLLSFQSTRPRGARPKYVDKCTLCSKFQSTRPRGARPIYTDNGKPELSFQSTRPRGARPGAGWTRSSKSCFNPRARVGRDGRQRAGRLSAAVSIHAPAWGATAKMEQGLPLPAFQSTRPRGARLLQVLLRETKKCFNPRARVGRDLGKTIEMIYIR